MYIFISSFNDIAIAPIMTGKVCSCESAGSVQSSGSTGMIVGVVIGLLGVAVGVSGLIGGAVIVKRRRYTLPLVSLLYAYSVMLSTLCYRATEAKGDMANLAYSMSGPHGKPAETEGEYDIPQYPEPPSGAEGIYVCVY